METKVQIIISPETLARLDMVPKVFGDNHYDGVIAHLLDLDGWPRIEKTPSS